MNEKELNDLIKFSPANLKNFFEDSVVEQEHNLPSYGYIKNGQISFKVTKQATLDKE